MEGEGDNEELKKDIGNFLGTGYMHFLGCIDGFVGAYIYQNLANCAS